MIGPIKNRVSTKSLTVFILLLPILISIIWFFKKPAYLSFVDVGRYSDVARNLVEGKGFKIGFTFLGENLEPGPWRSNLPPSYIFVIATLFKLFGPSDQVVVSTSFIFFILLCFATYFLARKIFDEKTAILSLILVSFNTILLSSSENGASEIFISFLLISTLMLVSLKRDSAIFLAGIFSSILFFSKIHAPVYLLAPIVFLFKSSTERQKHFLIFFLPQFVALIFLKLTFSLKFPDPNDYWPIFLQNSALFPADNLPRAGMTISIETVIRNLGVVVSKTLYDLYNLGKSFNFISPLPWVASPFIIISSFLALFLKGSKEINNFKLAFSVSFAITILAIALGVPHVRYLHPFIPLLIILAAAFIEKSRNTLFQGMENAKVTFLILLFVLFQPIGLLLLDSRFDRKTYNINKAPAHYVIAKKLTKEIKENSTIVTNLDTWATWYGRINSIIIPLERENFLRVDKTVKADAIALTDFQKDNEDHPLTGFWEKLFFSPETKDVYIQDNFKKRTEIIIDKNEVYENQQYKIVILERS